MKRFLPLLSFALLVSAVASAQGLRYGVTGGLNFSSFAMDAGGLSVSTDSRMGFNAGFKMEIGAPFILDGFYFDGEVLLSSKGTKFRSVVEEQGVKTTVRPYYLEIPIHIGYRHTVDKSGNISVFGSFGPYFGIGLFGKSKVTSGNLTEKVDTFGSGGLKRFDFGLGLRAGVELYKRYQVFVGYDWGLVDIAKGGEDNYRINNRNFYVGMAYMF